MFAIRWVATQDDELLVELEKIPNAPVFRMTVNGIVLQKPPAQCKQVQEQKVDQMMHVSEWEKNKDIMKHLKSQKPSQHMEKKQKRAQGPNPLSCKKKTKVGQDSNQQFSHGRNKRPRRRHKESSEKG